MPHCPVPIGKPFPTRMPMRRSFFFPNISSTFWSCWSILIIILTNRFIYSQTFFDSDSFDVLYKYGRYSSRNNIIIYKITKLLIKRY